MKWIINLGTELTPLLFLFDLIPKLLKQLLAEMIKGWWNEPLPNVRPRDIRLADFINAEIKKIITVVGFRRVGKTFTMFDFAREYGKGRCLYFNFEDERIPQKTEVLTNLLSVARELKGGEPLVFLLDEIQQIPDWSLWARRVNETTSHRLVLSGSSSKLSSNEISTELRGHSLDALRDLIRILLNTRDYTYTKLANTMRSLGHDIGKTTVIRYMRWLESSYFLSSVEICSPSIKQKIQTVRKAYIIDTFFSSKFSTAFSQNIGHLMEQSVWYELRRRSARDPVMSFAYWRDYSQHEADFVVMDNRLPREIIQVTHASSFPDVPEREVKSAVKAAAKLSCKNIVIVTWEAGRIEKVGDCEVRFVPLWKWLL